jgi:hypothetical protein
MGAGRGRNRRALATGVLVENDKAPYDLAVVYGWQHREDKGPIMAAAREAGVWYNAAGKESEAYAEQLFEDFQSHPTIFWQKFTLGMQAIPEGSVFSVYDFMTFLEKLARLDKDSTCRCLESITAGKQQQICYQVGGGKFEEEEEETFFPALHRIFQSWKENAQLEERQRALADELRNKVVRF